MKLVTIVGARPQFIKSVPVSRELNVRKIKEIKIHTGQHFDVNMNDIFFRQLKIKSPEYSLNINNLFHGAMTGQMLEKIEQILIQERPNYVIVYGDTNSTLAGALAASKLRIKIIHIEAGLRSNNWNMPEEINRIITDRLSYLLCCPTETAVKNLISEGFNNFNCKVINCGDVMFDSLRMFSTLRQKPEMNLPDRFLLCTIHRQENTDDVQRLNSIFEALKLISREVDIILPLHPRTLKQLNISDLAATEALGLRVVDPVGYLEMLFLLQKCDMVLTDSGGLQKEAFFSKKLCLTLRDETEWIELVDYGFNFLAGWKTDRIVATYRRMSDKQPDFNIDLYGNGQAAKKIVDEILR
jgi:UDP-GlcNAc3NAcA epimerase